MIEQFLCWIRVYFMESAKKIFQCNMKALPI